MADFPHTIPAPLPSLNSALSRRAALFGTVAATGFLGAAATTEAATIEAEPIVAMHRRFLELQAESDALFAVSEATCDGAWDRTQNAAGYLTERSLSALPTTLPGAVAALAWARWEFGRHYVETAPDPDWMDRWTLAMIDGALAVLRQQAA